MRCMCKNGFSPYAWNACVNSTRILFIFTWNPILKPMVMAKSSNHTPILNFIISLQKAHGLISDHVMRYYVMWCMIWKLEAKRRILQKEPLNLQLRSKRYAHLKFYAHLAMIGSYLLIHSSDVHHLGLFGNGRERSSTFMLDKISFEAFLMT